MKSSSCWKILGKLFLWFVHSSIARILKWATGTRRLAFDRSWLWTKLGPFYFDKWTFCQYSQDFGFVFMEPNMDFYYKTTKNFTTVQSVFYLSPTFMELYVEKLELLSQREESKDLLLSHQEFAEKLPGLWAFVIFIHRLFLMEFCAAKIHDYWTYCIRNWYWWSRSKGTLTTTY